MTARTVARSTLGWAFGMAVSILLLSLWGRAVIVDTDRLAESLTPLAGASIVKDFVGDWMVDEMVDSGIGRSVAEPTIDRYLESSGVGNALDQLVNESVHAAASPDPDGAAIDMAGLFSPAVPEFTQALNVAGHPATESEVANVVAQFDPLVIRPPGSEPAFGPNSTTASRLGTAALLALLALIGLGLAFVSLSEDRVGALRSLMSRVAIGGVSFAVFLRVGSWVLDPEGGRAPVEKTMSELARSEWIVPLQVAAVAALVAGAIYVGRRWFRPEEESRSPDEQPTPRAERPRSLSGRR